MLLLLLLVGRMGLEQRVQGRGRALLVGVLLLRGEVPLGGWSIWRDHGSGLAAGCRAHSVVGVRIGTRRRHVGIVVVARVLLVLHRRLAVHLVLVLGMLLVHARVMLRKVVHVRRGSVFAVGRITGRAGIAGGWHVMPGRFVRVHAGRRPGPVRMRRVWRWPTGCRRRSATTAGSIATGRRFRCLFTTHYMRILSTLVSVSTILQITRLVCL